MEKSDSEPTSGCGGNHEDTSQLSRNRSFKSKQLVRSQAIRETASPPCTASPSPPSLVTATEGVRNNSGVRTSVVENATSDNSSQVSDDVCGDGVACAGELKCDDDGRKIPVEIQITTGGWEVETQTVQRQRTRRWLGHKQQSQSATNLLSNNPRVACVCGACAACPHCRGQRRKPGCPIKQDSGIVCSEDCPDCSDTEPNGAIIERKSASLDVDEQPYYCRCPDRRDKLKGSLSRTDSEEKTEPTGVDLVNFIKETLNKNGRDRMTLLKIEKELHSLVNDTGRCIVRFPVMTSYGRMLVHRCAALFELTHHLDQSSKNSVLVSKTGTSGGCIPCTSFKQWCTANFPPSPQRHQPDSTHAKSILKRDAHSLEEECNNGRNATRSKSLEQRERDYERARRRIFSTDNCTQDESQWPWLNAGPVKLLTPESGRNKLLKVQSLETNPGTQQNWRCRGAVSKSHSFGGYGGGEPQPRLLSRQGDLASSSWRVSPSSSGYKTLSLRSTDSVTPSPTGGASPEPCVAGAVVWAVTDVSRVPPGAVVIHPQTGRPLTNPDGSVYHFDPAHPPVIYDAAPYPRIEQPKIEENCEKRRGRLEKQHSIIHNDVECRRTEECNTKCCCECRRQTAEGACQHKPTGDKMELATQTDQAHNINQQIQGSPCKNRYEHADTISNHHQTADLSANHRPPDDIVTNERIETSSQIHDEARHFDQHPVYEVPPNTRYETVNQRYENSRPASFEPARQTPVYDVQANHRAQAEAVNHGAAKMSNQEQDMQQYVAQSHNYMHGYRPDEITSPHQPVPNPTFVQTDVGMQNMMTHAKMTSVPGPDHNGRPVSLTNMVYPTAVPQPYPYNQCRVDQPMHPGVYQAVGNQHNEEQKPINSPHNEGTFRIDPSYPYANEAGCGACAVAPNVCPDNRSYNVSYGQVEVQPQVVGTPYHMPNVILPQHQIPHYPQYQEQVQWAPVASLPAVANVPPMPAVAPVPLPMPLPVQQHKLYLHDVYPLLQYPNMTYPQYNVYPQVIPQPYPVCQPMYPVVEKPETSRRNSTPNHRPKRNSIPNSARNTPLTSTNEKRVPYEDNTNNKEPNFEGNDSNEIAVKIKQIKDQMAQLNTKDDKRGFNRRDEWRRRNSGNGILGSYPVNMNGRVSGPPVNDETQLTSAARAIVNSIRNMQAKNTNCSDNRRPNDYQNQGQRDNHKQDSQGFRNRRQDKEEKSMVRINGGQTGDERNDVGQRSNEARNRNVNPVPFQYRPPYLLRQISPGTWCRRSPGAVHPVLNQPRRPYPDTRNQRR